MGAEGIDVPAIPTGPDGLPDLQAIAEQVDTSRVDVRAALGACASILVAAGVIDLQSDPEVRALVQDLLGRYAECMRAEGIAEFPDPTPGFTGAGPPYPLESVPFDHSDFVDAASTCQRLLGAVEGMP